MFWNKYPYTNFHELNLDWILKMVKELHAEWDEFKVLNTITFAGSRDITKQYVAWAIVDANGGTEGYISIKPVPPGVDISNTEYWQSIVNYNAVILAIRARLDALEECAKMKKAAIFGNSFAGGVNGVVGIYHKIKHLYNSTVYYNRSGAGFLPYTNHPAGDQFIDAVTGAAYDAEVTDVVILGAAGEARSMQEYSTVDWVTAMRQAVQDFVAMAKTKYPNAKKFIYVNCSACPALHTPNNYEASGYTDYQNEFWVHNLMGRCVAGSDLIYGGWAGWDIMLNPAYFQIDYVHPNQSGTDLIPSRAIQILTGGSLEYAPMVFIDSVTMHLGSTVTAPVTVTQTVTPYETRMGIRGAGSPSGSESMHLVTIQVFDDGALSFYPPIGRYLSAGGNFAGYFQTLAMAQFNNATSHCREIFSYYSDRNITMRRTFFDSQTVNTSRADRFPYEMTFKHDPLNASELA